MEPQLTSQACRRPEVGTVRIVELYLNAPGIGGKLGLGEPLVELGLGRGEDGLKLGGAHARAEEGEKKAFR